MNTLFSWEYIESKRPIPSGKLHKFKGPRSTRFSKEKAISEFLKKSGKSEVGECWNWQGAKSRCNRKPPYIYRGNYKVFGFSTMASRISFLIHKGPFKLTLSVCHHCDNPMCVNPNHLFLGTDKENASDMINKGRSLRGEKHKLAILTESDVLEIRRVHTPLKKSGPFTPLSLSKKYGVEPVTIAKVLNRTNWWWI